MCRHRMDAKFRSSWHRGELSALLTDLVKTKGCGQEKYLVSILQPQAHAVFEPVLRLRLSAIEQPVASAR